MLIHTDVCGPMRNESFGGSRYFITFIDDYSRYSTVYILKRKSEALEYFKTYEKSCLTQLGYQVRSLRSDNGGEYVSQEFESYLKERGIKHETTSPHSPQQNGVAERKNRTLCEAARSMLNHAGLPTSYWAEAVSTANYCQNR